MKNLVIMYAKVGVADYKRLRQVAKKTKSKVKIQNKKGLPFLAHKYRKRKNLCIPFWCNYFSNDSTI